MCGGCFYLYLLWYYGVIDCYISFECCRFVAACGYYGLSLNLTALSGNKYFNLFLGGLCELPAYVSAIFIVRRFASNFFSVFVDFSISLMNSDPLHRN